METGLKKIQSNHSHHCSSDLPLQSLPGVIIFLFVKPLALASPKHGVNAPFANFLTFRKLFDSAPKPAVIAPSLRCLRPL